MATFTKILSDFNPTLALTTEKTFKKPWLETEKEVKVSYKTSPKYFGMLKKRIDDNPEIALFRIRKS